MVPFQVLRDADRPLGLVLAVGQIPVPRDAGCKDVDVVVVGVLMPHGLPLHRLGIDPLVLGHPLHVIRRHPVPLLVREPFALGQR